MRKILIVALVSWSVISLVGCGQSNNPTPAPDNTDSNPSPDVKVLATQDRGLLASLDSSGAKNFDAHSNLAYSKIFGGSDGPSVLNYFDTRIHYMLSPADAEIATVTPGKPKYDGWTRSLQESTVQVGAVNIGTRYWLQAILDQTPYIISFRGKDIPVDSSRVGIMLIGPGYKDVETSIYGEISIPPSYRQGILLHEARHSDCTGGITQAQLDQIRKVTSAEEFMANFKHRECGHMHTICPQGHQYAGYPACDTEPWGAYAVGAIFYRAQELSAKGQEQHILDIATLDAVSRLQYDWGDLLAGRLGDPDMSSEGVR